MNAIIRLSTLMVVMGLARSTVYLRIQDGLLTRGVSLGGRAVGWPTDEVAAINAARIASNTDDEIKELV